MQDAELIELLTIIRQGQQLDEKRFVQSEKSNQAFEKMAHEFRPLLIQRVNRIIEKFAWKGLTSNDFDELYSHSLYYLYEYVSRFKIPDHNVYQTFSATFFTILGKKLIDNVYELDKGPVQTSKSTTMTNIRAVAKFIQDFQKKYNKQPSVEIIANALKISTKLVESYLESGTILNIRHNLSGQTELDDSIKSNDPMLDERYLNVEQKRIIRQTKNRVMQKIKKDVFRLMGESAPTIQNNYIDILDMLYKQQGKNVPTVAEKYKLDINSHKVIRRLWARFLELMKKDDEFRKYFKANIYNSFIKIAKTAKEQQLIFETKLSYFQHGLIKNLKNQQNRMETIQHRAKTQAVEILKRREICKKLLSF